MIFNPMQAFHGSCLVDDAPLPVRDGVGIVVEGQAGARRVAAADTNGVLIASASQSHRAKVMDSTLPPPSMESGDSC